MNWKVLPCPSPAGRSPWRIVDEAGQEVPWLNDFLDAQCLRALSPLTLRMYAFQLLHFGRWWSDRKQPWADPPHTLMADYIRFQLGEQPTPSAPTINARLELVRRLCQFHFGYNTADDPRLRRPYRRRFDSGYGRRQPANAEVRLKQPIPVIQPLSTDEVARFWASFRHCRDMALIALMLFNGLRSRELLNLKLQDLRFSEAQIRVFGKGRRERILPLKTDTLRLVETYLRTERPLTGSPYVFVALQGKMRGLPMTPAGLRSLFRHHRRASDVSQANPHRFRHTFGADMVRAGVSLPALMHLMGHVHVQTTMRYASLTPADVWREFERAVQRKISPSPKP
jgi:integrase/recombinase XerD